MAWTDEQLTAINGRGKFILVSAAAGSGKTAVLVERVIRRLTNPETSEDITDFLIITFTKAAAAEMRSRIAAALGEALAQNPQSAHLRRQMNLLHSARIMTVHAFCLSLIRDNFHVLNINPDFRLLSEDEVDALMDEALENLLENEYKNAVQGGDFYALVESVSGPRDDRRLGEMILAGCNSLMNQLSPELFLRETEKALDFSGVADAGATKWGRVYLRDIAEQARYWLSIYNGCIEKLTADESGLCEKYLPCFTAERDALSAFADAADGSCWDRANEVLFALQNTPPLGRAPKECDGELKDYVKRKRDYVKSRAKKIAAGILSKKSGEVIDDMRSTAGAVREFWRLVTGFCDEYRRIKSERGYLDFNDLEHLALRLLTVEENGKLVPTEIALDVGSGISELMVDEYQDTNSIQDEIFKALTAAGGSFFAVGDVKQSIYRFRGANPGIFHSKINEYDKTPARERGSGEVEFEKERVSVVLRRNFRSSKGVIDGVNFVFKALMSEGFGEMEYTSEQELAAHPDMEEKKDDICELDIIDMSAGSDGEDGEGENGEDEDSEDLAKLELEAKHIANRIKNMLLSGRNVFDKELNSERRIRPSDIAVLLRSRKDRAPVIASALNEAGIEVYTDAGDDFLSSAEINAVFSLLSVVDNPFQDTHLIGCLRSPVFGFTANELGEIRLSGGTGGSFYDALEQCTKSGSPTGAKCSKFLEQLNDMRMTTADMSVGSAVGEIIDRSGAAAIFGAMEGGEQRKANLRHLFELAAEYEKRGGCCIGGFLKYLSDASKRGKIKEPGAARGGTGGVRIMTIHHSKGLEFPVVILACAADKVNERWRSDPMLFHPELGIGIYKRDRELGAEYTTLIREAVAAARFNEQLSEELRGLYVAMTRAREKLIITAAHKNAQKELCELENDGTKESIAAVCKRVKSIGRWVETAVWQKNAPFVVNFIKPGGIKSVQEQRESHIEQADIENEYRRIRKNLSYKYPFEASCEVPAKLTATGFGALASGEEISVYEKGRAVPLKVPKFMAFEKSLTPTEKGTAVHLAMQLLPVLRYENESEVQSRIYELADRGILSAEQARAVDPGIILGFYKSETGRHICALDRERIRREFKFSVLVNAEEYFPELTGHGERILLQGVIDLCYEEPDGTLTIVDFKTDRVKKGEAAARAKNYLPQLSVYKRALSEITGKAVSRAILYFFETGEAVDCG